MKGSVIYEDLLQQGEQRGIEKEALKVTMMQLSFRFPQLEQRLINQIKTLSLSELENLALALLEFKDVNDLDDWLGYPE